MIWTTVVDDSLSDIRGMACDDIPLERFRFPERPARCEIIPYSRSFFLKMIFITNLHFFLKSVQKVQQFALINQACSKLPKHLFIYS